MAQPSSAQADVPEARLPRISREIEDWRAHLSRDPLATTIECEPVRLVGQKPDDDPADPA